MKSLATWASRLLARSVFVLALTAAVLAVPQMASAQKSGGNFSGGAGNSYLPLPEVQTIVGKLKMDIPGPGIVVINTSSYAAFNSNPSGVVCGITKDSKTLELDTPRVVGQNHDELNARRMPVNATRGFEEKKEKTRTYRYICYAQNNSYLYDVTITGVFVQKRYGPKNSGLAQTSQPMSQGDPTID